MRKVDADAVVARIIEVRDALPPEQSYEVGYHNGLSMAHAIVLAAPTIEEKTGRWLYSSTKNARFRVCDQCACAFVKMENQSEYNYCPNCGCCMEVDNG